MERTIAGLGKRRFLLHNVHEDEPVVFNTRWVLSYLAGPLTRNQIRTLMGEGAQERCRGRRESRVKTETQDAPRRPHLHCHRQIKQYYVAGHSAPRTSVYHPRLIAGGEIVVFSSVRYQVEESNASVLHTVEICRTVPVDS